MVSCPVNSHPLHFSFYTFLAGRIRVFFTHFLSSSSLDSCYLAVVCGVYVGVVVALAVVVCVNSSPPSPLVRFYKISAYD